MKWLPDPRVPSCRSHRLAYAAGSKPASAASARSCSSRRSVCSRLIVRFAAPALSGTARSIAWRSGLRSSGRSLVAYWVRTAIMPQPMSTPTRPG